MKLNELPIKVQLSYIRVPYIALTGIVDFYSMYQTAVGKVRSFSQGIFKQSEQLASSFRPTRYYLDKD